MKKRRSLIVVVLLILALTLGIGYAALSRELVIGSEANLAPNEEDFNIVFTEATIDEATKGTASVTGGGKNAHYTLTGLSAKGDKAIMTFTIQNQTPDVDATLVSVSTVGGSLFIGDGTANSGDPLDYFEKEVVVKTGGQTYNGNDAFVLGPNETATVTITVTLQQTVTQKVTLTGASVILNFSGQ